MDAVQRKEAWINIEDEMWELEIRWQWLLSKVKEGRTGNFLKLGLTSLILESASAPEEPVADWEEVPAGSVKCSAKSSLISDEIPCVPGLYITNSLVQFLENLIKAVGETVQQMTIIKDLMWASWKEDSISESFYDFLHYSHQLLESLSSTWGMVMSIFRSSQIEMLYRSEKIVAQVAFSHQLSVELIMECWRSYLAIYNRKKPFNISYAQVKVRSSSHAVGECYSRALLSSHLFTLSISTVLLKVGVATEQVHSEINGSDEGSGSKGMFINSSKPSRDSREGERPPLNDDQHPYEFKRIAHYGYSAGKEGRLKNSSNAEESERKHSSLEKLPIRKLTRKYAFKKVPNRSRCRSQFNETHSPQGHAYHLLTQPREESSQERSTSTKKTCCHQCCLQNSCSATHNGHDTVDPQASCPFEETEGTSSHPVCSCCFRNSKLDQDMDDDCEETISHKSSSSSSSSSSLVPRFTQTEWDTLLNDCKDLRADLQILEKTVPQSTIEESFIRKLKCCKEVDGDEVKILLQKVSSLPLRELFSAIVSSQITSLEFLENELTLQIDVWQKRENQGILQSQIKGLDPEEAFLQAKNLLNQHMQAYFSLMLLLKAAHKRRFLHYSAQLCESFSEARIHASGLVLARGTFSNKVATKLLQKYEEVPADAEPKLISDVSFVNPHTLSHQHSLALANAHAFCDTMFSFLLTR